MQIIRELSDYIGEELEDAEKYAVESLKFKGINRELAEMYYNLANDELKHSTILHTNGVRMIEEYKKENEVPTAMQSVYDYLHERYIERANKVKVYLAQYSG